ncbi:MAG: J domain-containing protein [Spirochaetaceae bacterium]
MTYAQAHRVLGVGEDVDLNGLRTAYHRAAKENHPDLAPTGCKKRAESRMMRVNEAYMRILADRMTRGERHTVGAGTAVGRLRDPGYVYYRLGFECFRRGYTELCRKDPRIIRCRYVEVRTYDHYLLTLTISALGHFERSYRYFASVIEHAPQSIWVPDARAKLRKLEKFNRLYERICENLSRNVQAKRVRYSEAVENR